MFFSFLERNAPRLGDGVFLEKTLVGDPAVAFAARLRSADGSARLVEDGDAPPVLLERLVDVLARWPELPPPCFVKIDTDGCDLDIIAASEEVWRRDHPAIFFEYDPALMAVGTDPLRVLDILAAAGYRDVLVYENTGEYMLSLDTTNRSAFEDLHAYFSARASARYADLCAFHRDDADVSEAFRRSERRLSRDLRLSAQP